MAKIVSVFLILAVLGVALPAVHRVSAANPEVAPRAGLRVHGLPPSEEAKVLEAQKKWAEKLTEAELDEKIDNLSDVVELVIQHYKDDQALPEGFHYFKVTGIMVGGGTLQNGEGFAILSRTFSFLNKEAYEQLKNEFSASKTGKFGMLHKNDGGAAEPVTLLFPDDNKIEYRWQKRSDEFMFLPILPLP